MNSFKLLAVGASVALLTGVVSAQTGQIDYSHNWAPMSDAPAVGFSGPGIFGFLTGDGDFAGPGDAIRRCYGVDTTQGGRNWSVGAYENSWFNVGQGYAAANPVQLVDVGLIGISAATDSDMGADACFAPFFASAGNTGGWQLGASAVLGAQSGTSGNPFPTVWEIAFQWVVTSTVTAGGLGGPTTIGSAAGNPLLVNVIYEIQGPATGGPTNNQYYLASTTELTGINPAGTGGVTNGNTGWGSSLFGATADLTNTVSHTRLFANSVAAGGIASTNIFFNQVGDTEFVGHLAFNTPFLWAEKDGSRGAGGADWQVSASPVSAINVRVIDHKSGGQTNTNINYKIPAAGGPAANFDAGIVFNQSFFLWSATTSTVMPQMPTSWTDLGPTALPGVIPVATSREGFQNVPVNFDALTSALLAVPGLSLGTKFTGSDDVFYDAVGGGLATSSIWEGMFDAQVSGVSGLSLAAGGSIPAVAVPSPSLAGVNLGLCNLGLQIKGGALVVTEFANSLEINLQ